MVVKLELGTVIEAFSLLGILGLDTFLVQETFNLWESVGDKFTEGPFVEEASVNDEFVGKISAECVSAGLNKLFNGY